MPRLSLKTLIISFVTLFSFHSFAESIVDVSPLQLTQQQSDDWLILDVRTPEEYQQGHVPNAVNIPHTEIADNLAQLLDHKDKPVVVYCRSGFRAAKAGKILIENGFSQVKHLEGDMKGWEASGNPIEK